MAGREVDVTTAYNTPAASTTHYTYDPAGRLGSVTLAYGSPEAATTSYTYTPAGAVRSIEDANLHTTWLDYDRLGRLTEKTLPDGSYEQYTYDRSGDLISHRLTDGSTNTFTYDSRHRLTLADYFDGNDATYGYTPTGRRAWAANNLGTTNYTYDAQNRVVSITAPHGQVSYTYDAANNRRSMTTPAGTTSYTYNKRNLPVSMTEPGSLTSTLSYNTRGLLTQIDYPNGVVEEYQYDALDRVTDVVQYDAQTTLASYAYTYDVAGNPLTLTELDGSLTTWEYDAAYRLVRETRPDGGGGTLTTDYTYDNIGNRLSAAVTGGSTTTYTYNNLDELTQVAVDGQVTTTYGYDGRGNMISMTDTAGVTSYSYDAEDRLTGVLLPDMTDLDYAYDTAGRRVQQTVNGTDTNYLWDETSRYGDVVLETDGGGALLVSYGLVDGRLLSQHRGGVDSYYLHDARGSTRALVDSAGTVTDTYRYAAFGDIYAQTGSTLNNYLYTGQQHDNLTGLYSLRARYYEPRLGRFISRDPYPVNYRNPIEYNRYVYGANSPVRYSDPSGLTGVLGRTLQRVSVTVPVLLIALIFGAALLNAYILIKDSLAFELPWSLSGGGAGTATEEDNNTEGGGWCPPSLCPDSSGEQEQSSDPNVPGLQDGQAPTSDDFLPNVDDLPDDPSPSLTLPSVGNPAGTNYPVPDPERAAGQLVFWVAVSFTTAAIIGISLLPGSGSGTTSPPTPQPTATPSCPSIMRGGIYPNIPDITLWDLVHCRPEVLVTWGLILNDGPFPYPEDNGQFYNWRDQRIGNKKPLRPISKPDQYREYTVDTPGHPRRGLRRIVTLGDQNRQPSQYYPTEVYYTDEHYEHFFRIWPMQ